MTFRRNSLFVGFILFSEQISIVPQTSLRISSRPVDQLFCQSFGWTSHSISQWINQSAKHSASVSVSHPVVSVILSVSQWIGHSISGRHSVPLLRACTMILYSYNTVIWTERRTLNEQVVRLDKKQTNTFKLISDEGRLSASKRYPNSSLKFNKLSLIIVFAL
jgi:hypothetical protein